MPKHNASEGACDVPCIKKDRSKGKVVPMHAMKAHRGSGGELHSCLTLALDLEKWSASRPGKFAPWG
jgi:hypothetical protein